ncbi:MAG: hypothetical protein IMZ70_02235 [Candidatus Atribacteria bacterium]|nr:hypothetical protein [Candidatus Atribacteria bacterium]
MYYPGNKNIQGLIQKIVNQIPPCTDFYELFAGTAAVSAFLHRGSTEKTIFHINDLDPSVTDSFVYPAGSIILNLPAVDIIKFLSISPTHLNFFVFIDPPYHHDTRPFNKELYKFEMSHTDHVELLSSVQDLKCNCMIIHPQCELYDQALKSWRTVQVKVRYHNKTSIENLYMNYPDPTQLLSYGVAGKDCWDRQRIKRKGDRLVNKLLSLPDVERNYILNRLSSSFIN